MEVILTNDVVKLGDKNDLVKVKPGYGRNYLIPQGLAIVANDSNKRAWEDMKRQDARREDKLMKELQSVVSKLQAATVKVGAKAGTNEKLFGTVTSLQLADAIKKQLNIPIDRKKIQMPEEVKTLGAFVAVVDLHKDLKVELNFEVFAE
jgi:large subunit ribosomal protein L9